MCLVIMYRKHYSLCAQYSIRLNGTQPTLMCEFFVNYHDQAYVGCDVHEIWRKPFVKPWHSFVPPSLFYTIPTARVAAVLVLQSCTNHLVRIRCRSGNQFGNGSKQKIFRGCLREKLHLFGNCNFSKKRFSLPVLC